MSEERDDTDFIANVSFTDFLGTLRSVHGEKFSAYREEFHKTLNYETNGFIPPHPVTVSIELVNRCNLKCVMCFTDHHGNAKATLDLETANRIFTQCRELEVPALVIGMGSEPLLYKNIREILSGAKASGAIDIFLGTNGVLLDEEMCEFLVQSGIERVEISVDAASADTYLKVRQKDEFERVTANIRRLIETRKRLGSKLPIIRLCFCTLDINRHERQSFLDEWRDKVDYIDFQLAVDHTGLKEMLAGKELAGLHALPLPSTYCTYPFSSLHVYADGEIAPCCSFHGKNTEMSLGNIRDTTLAEAWSGAPLKEIRRQLLTGEVNDYCRACLAKRDQDAFSGLTIEKK